MIVDRRRQTGREREGGREGGRIREGGKKETKEVGREVVVVERVVFSDEEWREGRLEDELVMK